MSKIRVVGWLLVMVLLVHSSAALAEFDLSLFKNDSRFNVKEDVMNDTITIEIVDAESGTGLGTAGENAVIAVFTDIKLASKNLVPPTMRMILYYRGEDWVFVDTFILKTSKNRYTFKTLEGSRNVLSGGLVSEQITIPLTDESLPMIKDILDDSFGTVSTVMVDYRISGDRYVDGTIVYLSAEGLRSLYDTYVAAGGLDLDFSDMNTLYPVEVKSMTD